MSALREAVIVSAVRTPMGRALKGNYVNLRADDLGAVAVREAVSRVKNLDPNDIEDLVLGCAMPEGEQGMNVARNISFLAGLPNSVAAVTVNRFCSSSLQTIFDAARAIMVGDGEVFVAVTRSGAQLTLARVGQAVEIETECKGLKEQAISLTGGRLLVSE